MKTGLLTALMAVGIFSLSAAFMSWNAEQTVELSNYEKENAEVSTVSGNSALSCRSNIQLSLGYEGYGVLEPEMLLADKFSDYSRFEVEIVDPPVNTDTADCSMVGDHIMVEVRDTVNDMMCWSSVLVEDKLPPQVSCDTVDASCNRDPFANNYNIYLPDLSDNCTDTSDLSITYNQSQISQGCQSDFVLIINRTWFITDEYGNTTTCEQIIRFERPDIDSVVFPENDTLDCSDTDTDPAITGMPTLNGEEISMQCGLMVWNEDNVIDKCGGTFKVLRTWYVMDWCRNVQRSNLQMIFIIDTLGPDITCPTDTTITNAPGECYGFYDIPEIDVTDDCADSSDFNFDFYVNGVYTTQTENIQLPVGDNSIRVVVEDGCFNYSECTYTVTVVDSETPTVVCFDDYFALPSSGAATVGPEAFSAINYMDNCGVVDTVIRRMNTHCGNNDDLNFGDEITFCCEDVGDTIMVEVKAFDAAGNMNSCMFEVIVQDNLPPMVICPADTTVGCDQLTGDLSMFGSPMITDNCAFTVDSSVSVNLDACKEGTITRTWVATDEFGNIGSCTQTITVINPDSFNSASIVWPADTVLSACSMGGTHPDSIGSVPQFDQTSCETVGVTFTDMTMDPDSACLDLMRTWTIYDSCTDSTFTHVQMVQIINNAPPVLTVPSDTLLFADVNCQGMAALDSAFTNDCSSGVTFENSYTEGGALVDTLFPLGSTIIIFTATDECNNVSTDTTIVTVEDITPPEISCIPDTVISTDPLVCEGTVDLPGPSTADNCSVDSIVNDYNFTADASDTYPIGTTTVTYTVFDGSGNSSTCSFTVTVEDNEAPELSCPTDTILLYLDESCEVDIPDFTDSISVSDNCSPADSIQFVQTPMSGTTLMMVQDTFVQIIATDTSGNSDTCQIAISLVDTLPPSIICPEDDTLYADNNCEAIIGNYRDQAMVMSNCTEMMNVEISQTPDSGTVISGAGTVVEVTMTAEDASGNIMSCTFDITLLDTFPPSIMCPPDTTVSADPGVCEAAVSINIPGFDDNCIVDTVYNDFNGTIDASDNYEVGETVVTYTVEDNSGNFTTCSFTVTVEDNEPPVVNCPPDLTIQLNPDCEAEIPYFRDSITVSDNCTPLADIDFTQTPDSGTVVFGEGDTLVQIIVTDDAGNSSSCSFTIFFVDTVPPSITCPSTDTLYVDTLCSAIVGDYRPDAIVSDNCTDTSLITIDQIPDSGTIVSGSDTIIEISLIATDLSGNSDTCTFDLELLDTIQPTIACPGDVTLYADEECKAIIPDLADSVVISDNCDPDMTIMATQSPSAGDTLMGEQTITITFTATDMNGQTQTCEISLTVVDTIPPTVICPPDSQLVADSLCQVTIPDVVNETFISDNCTDSIDLIVTQTPPADSVVDAQPGDTVCVVITVQDSSGNIDSCEVKFEVIDTTAPTLICTGDTTTIALDNNCAGAIPDLEGEITTLEDNCTGASNITITQIPSTGTVFILSEPLDTTVVITVTDSFGNSSSCSLVVSFVDTTPPTIICPPDTLVACGFTYNSLDTFGTATANDNCSPVTITTGATVHLNDCELIDSITRVFTATDENGNSSSCMQIIRYDGTVERLDVDDFTYPDTVLVADCNFLEPSDIPGSIPEIDTSLMLCNIIGYEYADSIIDNPSKGCIEILRTFTITDSCYFDTDSTDAQFELEQFIIVQDTTSPSFTVPVLDTMVYMDSCGTVDVILDSVTASDCAGIDTIYNNSSFAFSNSGGDISGAYEFGIHNVNVFAIDSCGNIDSVNIQITVTDSFPDTLICNFKIINNLDSNTLSAIFISHEFLGGYTDSCGNPPLGDITTSFDPMDLNDTIIVITCDSIDSTGGNYIKEGLIYIFLDSMLIDSCDIEMGIENPEICDSMMNIVAGQIVTARAERFNDAQVSVSNEATSKTTTTNTQGLYTVDRLIPDRMYIVDPDYGGDPRAGVSTFDILLILRHILGIEEIENPYFNIAGDVDKSKAISAADIIHLRKLLLRVENEMPVDNWRFVAEGYDFLNPTTAYIENYTEKILVDLSNNVDNVNFVGLKVGDVDGSIDMEAKGRSAPTILELEKADHHTIDLLSTKTEMIYGFQMAIEPEEMGSLQLIDGSVEFKYEDYRILEDGNILISWVAPHGLPVEKGETLFSISGVRTDQIHKAIRMNPEALEPEAYWRAENTPSTIELRYTGSDEEFALYQNAPNPWMDRTLISFTLQKAESVKINVIDAAGKEVFEAKLDGRAGYNELTLRATDLDGPGIYYYQLKGETFNASKKMIMLQ